MFKSKFTVYRPDRKTKKYQLVGITLSTTKKAFKHKYCASCAVYRSKIELLQFIGIPKGLNEPF